LSQQGRKAFSLQTLPPQCSLEESSTRVAKTSGFSLHVGVVAAAHERQKLERLCRYITRPTIAEQRLSLTCPSRKYVLLDILDLFQG
jgi:hypothetical protein